MRQCFSRFQITVAVMEDASIKGKTVLQFFARSAEKHQLELDSGQIFRLVLKLVRVVRCFRQTSTDFETLDAPNATPALVC